MTTPTSNQTLQNCCNSLSETVTLLSSSLDSLNSISTSFANLSETLTCKPIFTLVPSSDIESSQQNIRVEIEPRINKILSKIKHKVDKASRQRDALASKVRRNDVRLAQLRKAQERRATTGTIQARGGGGLLEQDEEQDKQRLRELQVEKMKLKMELSSYNLNRAKLNFRGSYGNSVALNTSSLEHQDVSREQEN
ncbi:hypothetical protein WICPIJ_009713 [Wickerhamomyces pijperi]|uniref:DASH complex subunit SPC19 n=1 Tax=Wickerhamomyces pijperi TaxID=599730 RepID=A0A9P8TCU1_WICPI|nr:hypothetical protein WICPIJ_009713 [Wickerhamomyces pijperi]